MSDMTPDDLTDLGRAALRSEVMARLDAIEARDAALLRALISLRAIHLAAAHALNYLPEPHPAFEALAALHREAASGMSLAERERINASRCQDCRAPDGEAHQSWCPMEATHAKPV